MPSYYYTLSGEKQTDFTYNRIGTYKKPLPSLHPYNKKRIKRETTYNKVCPSCGLTRSAMNLCECNS